MAPFFDDDSADLSPALLGVGYILGLNVGVVVVAGSVISWDIVTPIYHAFFLEHNAPLAHAAIGLNAEDLAFLLWSKQIRYLGVGAMLVGGIWTLVKLRSSLLSGIRSGLAVKRGGAHALASLPTTSRGRRFVTIRR